MNFSLILLLQIVLVLLVAPLVQGIAQFTSALVQKKERVMPWKTYQVLGASVKQGIIIPTDASWMFRVLPLLSLAVVLSLTVLFPLLTAVGVGFGVANVMVVASMCMLDEWLRVLRKAERGIVMPISRLPLFFSVIVFSLTTTALVAGSVDVMESAANGTWQSSRMVFWSIAALVLLVLADRHEVESSTYKSTGFLGAVTTFTDALRVTIFGVFISHLLVPFVIDGVVSLSTAGIAAGMFVVRAVLVGLGIGSIGGILYYWKFITSQRILGAACFCAIVGLVLTVTTSLL
jgi:formate hydrogenlyase subunit 4